MTIYLRFLLTFTSKHTLKTTRQYAYPQNRYFFHDFFKGSSLLGHSLVVYRYFFYKFPRVRHLGWFQSVLSVDERRSISVEGGHQSTNQNPRNTIECHLICKLFGKCAVMLLVVMEHVRVETGKKRVYHNRFK